MGLTANLVDSWEPYKAAKTALGNSLEPSNIKEQSTYHADKLNVSIQLFLIVQILSEIPFYVLKINAFKLGFD